MTKWLLAILLLATLCWGQSSNVPDQNTNTWGLGGALSGAAQNFPDTRGTITNQFEVVQSGTAGVLTMTVVGCMRGGTCSSTLASSSGNNSQIVTPSSANLNIFDFYKVTVSWTGGDATTKYVVNRTGTVAKLGGAAGSGTVTNTGGALTLNAVVLGAGGNDTKVNGVHTDDGTTDTYSGTGGILATTSGGLKAGANGGAAGVLSLIGSTSGTATCTAPAVAGTATNQVTCSNALLANTLGTVGGNAALALGAANNGLVSASSSSVTIQPGGATGLFIDANRILAQGAQWVLPNARNLGFVTSNFTTAANTSLQTITGLAFTMLATANNYQFHCALSYSQATAVAAVAFGIQAATNAPTNIFAEGTQQITAGPPSTYVDGTLPTLTTTTATNIVSGTPGVIATNYNVTLNGTIELAASANTVNFLVSTATSGDAVTVLRGSYCELF